MKTNLHNLNNFSENTEKAILHTLSLIAGCDKMIENFRLAEKDENSPQIIQEKKLKRQYCNDLTKLLQANQLRIELVEL
jgi:hypothetical protein